MSENQDTPEDIMDPQQDNVDNSQNEDAQNVTPEKTGEELLAEERDRYIRLFAEFENYKKRTTKERMEYFQSSNQDMMISMLGVLDDFERALKEISKNGNEADLQGVELITRNLKINLQKKVWHRWK